MTIKKESAGKLVIGMCLIAAFTLLMPLNVFAGAMQDLKDFFGDDFKNIQVDLGPVKIKPTLSIASEYNNNLHLTSSEKTRGMVYRVTPGFTLQVPLDRFYGETGADVSYVKAQNDGNAWMGVGRGILRYNFSDLTSIGVKETFERGFTYNFLTDNRYDLDDTYLDIKHQFGPRLAVTLNGERERYETHIKEGVALPFTDYHENGGGMSVDYKVTPTTSTTFTGYNAKRTYNDRNDKDYYKYGGTVGVTQKLTPHISVGAFGGQEWRSYKHSPDVREANYGANVDLILSNFSTLTMGFSHTLADTLYRRDPNALTNPFMIDQQLLYGLNEEYRFMKVNRYFMMLTCNLTDKDTLNISGEYLKSRSGDGQAMTTPGDTYLLDQQLKETNYYTGAQYTHKFLPWLAVNFKGSYGKRVTNERSNNVRNNYDYYTASGGLAFSY